MKTPDKIYLNKYMFRPGMMRKAQEPADEPEYEYIRKDLLLEWAKEKVALYERKMQEFEQGTEYEVDAYRQIVKKLNSK